MTILSFTGVLAYWVLVPETLPSATSKMLPADNSILTIVGNRIFAQHALCNMFCIATLVLFGANFSFILAQDYQFDSAASGLALALFNGSVALGTGLVWLLLPRFGEHRSIVIGCVLCTLGWLTIALQAHAGQPAVLLMALPLVAACMGAGIIMSLTSGSALTPFSHNSGTASSIYLLLQSAGAQRHRQRDFFTDSIDWCFRNQLSRGPDVAKAAVGDVNCGDLLWRIGTGFEIADWGSGHPEGCWLALYSHQKGRRES